MKVTVAIAAEAAGHAAAGPEAVGSRSPNMRLRIHDILLSPAGKLRASYANPANRASIRESRDRLKLLPLWNRAIQRRLGPPEAVTLPCCPESRSPSTAAQISSL